MPRLRIEYGGCSPRERPYPRRPAAPRGPTISEGGGVVDLLHEPAPRVAAVVRVVAHRGVRLGGQHDVVAAALQRLADDLLRLALRVDVGGVDEVDPGVQRLV